MREARRIAHIEPFRVMDVLARARALESAGKSIVHLEIGEPDFPTPAAVVKAGCAALVGGATHYLPALGLPALREAIAARYPAEAAVSAARVIVTPGASGALLLTLAAIVDRGDRVLMADPGYPCNRHFVRLFEGEPVAVPVDASSAFQLTAQAVEAHWDARTTAVILTTPSNPTGTIVPDEELARIVAAARARGGVVVVDETYHGLTYDADVRTALVHSPDVFVVNSFSKYYGMTGWRLGWLVAPAPYVNAIERLAQNLFISASTPAQHAALTAFKPAVIAELEERRAIFRKRRDFLLPALLDLGFDVPARPQGAFYIYADCSRHSDDGIRLAESLLTEAGVAVTPGADFGRHDTRRYLRFSYANTEERLALAVERIGRWLAV